MTGVWTRVGHCVYFPRTAGGFSLRDCPEPEQAARRIVACVNFCSGVGDYDLEESNGLLWLIKQNRTLKARLDELQAIVDSKAGDSLGETGATAALPVEQRDNKSSLNNDR
jgi:hypothetical protein